ncbi:chemotaxis protein CheA, partial [Candidatus Magnetaquicoccus inordinatus]|uniref:chemotaxis protein CheA n=1 Tax=Candidatus Magnetaquicoccus inordinatus TaxID=2496818 RepID=UPI00223921B5
MATTSTLEAPSLLAPEAAEVQREGRSESAPALLQALPEASSPAALASSSAASVSSILGSSLAEVAASALASPLAAAASPILGASLAEALIPTTAAQTKAPLLSEALSLPEQAKAEAEAAAPVAEVMIRVAATRLDQLLIKAEELIGLKQLYQQQVQNLRQLLPQLGAPKGLKALLKSMDQGQRAAQRMVDELLQTAKQLTLVESSILLDPLPRMVREIAREQGKEVEWRYQGSNVEVDRRILQAMGDPLLHLLRNALDHGLESPEERVRAGKPRCGFIEVQLRQNEGNRVEILVRDDGRGLDVQRIAALAVARGLLSGEQCANMRDEEIVELIFHSGFSTAERVTELSGRGLGMAIVRQAVEKLGGTLQIENH